MSPGRRILFAALRAGVVLLGLIPEQGYALTSAREADCVLASVAAAPRALSLAASRTIPLPENLRSSPATVRVELDFQGSSGISTYAFLCVSDEKGTYAKPLGLAR